MNDAAQFSGTAVAAAPPAAATGGRSPPPRRRLALRLAWLTVIIVLMVEGTFFVPSLVRQRADWLDRRLTEAQLAALSATVAPGGKVDPATRDELLRLAGAEAIVLRLPGHPETVLAPPGALAEAPLLDLRQESFAQSITRTGAALFNERAGLLRVEDASPLRPDATIVAVLHAGELHHALAHHAKRIGILSLLVAAAAGLLLYAALLVLLVRPMRRLTESIAAFRADPERFTALDDEPPANGREDEITTAARELAAMQRELRAALWRNARLAALGTAMAKVNHDLRGILSPAMLTAERLQMSADPAVKRAGDVLVRAVERAADLTRRTLEFTRETPMALPRRRMVLRPAVEEAAEQVRPACPLLAVANLVPPDVEIEADRESLVRVLGNLLRNAGEAEARRIVVTAVLENGELAITVGDDGPGLPEHVRAALFRPFVTGTRRGSTGLGLAIVHDLIRAHGGDIVLLDSGPGGTQFRLTLPDRIIIAPAPLAVGTGT